MRMMTVMVRGNPNWAKQNSVTWHFRVRGKNPNGETVTLGNYENEKEAIARYDQLVEEGYYRLLKVHPLKPKPADPLCAD